MQPRPQRVLHPERAGLAHQDQEGHLKGVVSLVFVTQDGQAGAQDHRAVPIDQGGESRLGSLAVPNREPSSNCPSVSPVNDPAWKSVWSEYGD